MISRDPQNVRIAGRDVPVITANTVVVGTGSAGFCAADRLWELGREDVVMVVDKVNAGTSRNAGSDKQTYYKLTLSGGEGDSVREMAQTLFSGGAMDGDNALVEAALSARGFLHLCDLGVPFPQNRYGEFIGYKTDHDPRRRATSVGPYTSRTMVEQLEKKVARNGTRIFDDCRVVDIIVHERDGVREVAGLLVLRTDVHLDPDDTGAESPFLFFRCANLVYATGGPAACTRPASSRTVSGGRQALPTVRASTARTSLSGSSAWPRPRRDGTSPAPTCRRCHGSSRRTPTAVTSGSSSPR